MSILALNELIDTQLDSKTNKKVYTTVIYPSISTSTDDLYITCNEMDRLDIIAYKYYGDSRYWKVLAQANNLGLGTLYIPGGFRLRIPKNTSDFILDFTALNFK